MWAWLKNHSTITYYTKTKIKDGAYQHTMAKGHLWLEIEISFDEKSENDSTN